MRRLLIVIGVAGLAAAAALSFAGTAHAASPIKECGSTGYSIHNITVRHLNCRDARQMARDYGFVDYGTGTRKFTITNGFGRRITYTCRQTIPDPRSYTVDVRCTYWFYVLRWQYDSGGVT